MLINAKEIRGFKLLSRDGEIGKAKDFFFDDQYWTIRYLVADTGSWLTGKQVLISPYSLINVETEKQKITINLSKREIEESPELETDRPVSRQYEESYNRYYGFPMYWSDTYMWGAYPYPYNVHDPEKWTKPTEAKQNADPHLRSTREVTGYHIEAIDGGIGHVDEFVIEVENWAIRYLIVDTKNWLPGKKVLISPQWIERVSWSDHRVYVNLTREAIEHSDEYIEKSTLTRDYEAGLHHHYGRSGYWLGNNQNPSKKRGTQDTEPRNH